ncbi:hypothetical protein KC338_g1889 [Hortaea werneckii]|uniref:Uncharacterized protein n=1 Tax=Hortaea werneckii TaxID=91943 RepID=A0A3M7FWX5_HORWE|nr:hypothetical protein KC323_g3108 [Hortaea werneckii]KAI6872916.1 hypothetical protein KC338_g1889 [Hortaea werneckii]KAI7351355.1 hypothetical protein KC320_g4993 [Hortaea werneckii]RMY92974.1 hypothetical protein D0862_09352 [Hortaea werneckii]
MADGLNQTRALRVAEILNDYRNILDYLSAIRANPSAEEYNEDGYVVLRKCVTQAQALLSQPFRTQGGSRGDEEIIKAHLRRIITDAAVRRFKAQKLYLQATAALRWINSRNAILQGQRAHAGHAPALQQIRNTLCAELASVTDQRVELSLRSADSTAGKWLQEDPSLATIQQSISCCNINGY